MTYSPRARKMTTSEALDILVDIASRWGENSEEGLPCRVQEDWSDEVVAAEIGGDDQDLLEQALEVGNLWRAIAQVRRVIDQQGCEVFDPAVTDRRLTTLCDIVIDG